MTIGKCSHGEFELEKGCQLCILANQMKEKLEKLDERQGTPTPDAAAEAYFTPPEEERPEQEGMEAGLSLVTPDPNAWRTGEEEMRPEETALVLRPGEDIEVHGYYEESQRLLEFAERRVIDSLEDNKVANDDLSIISKLKKSMESKRKERLEPLKAQADAIRDTYNYLMNPVLEAERLTKGKMGAYIDEQKRIRQEQEEVNRLRMEASQKEAALNNGELAESVNLVEVAPEVSKRVTTEMGTSGQRDNWKYEIEDTEAIPRAYMMPDLVMLNAIAKKYHDTKEVNGVRFFNEPIITNRARWQKQQ